VSICKWHLLVQADALALLKSSMHHGDAFGFNITAAQV
jgi:hypothetical protein